MDTIQDVIDAKEFQEKLTAGLDDDRDGVLLLDLVGPFDLLVGRGTVFAAALSPPPPLPPPALLAAWASAQSSSPHLPLQPSLFAAPSWKLPNMSSKSPLWQASSAHDLEAGRVGERDRAVVAVGVAVPLLRVGQVHDRVDRDEPTEAGSYSRAPRWVRPVGSLSRRRSPCWLGQSGGVPRGLPYGVWRRTVTAWVRGVDGRLLGALVVGEEPGQRGRRYGCATICRRSCSSGCR